jgi:hypothetical protein
MYRVFVFAVLITIVLTACNNPLSTPTLTPIPTPVPTQIPFSALQLDDLIIQPNDLPAGISGAQISHHEQCDSAAGNKCAEYYFNQDLAFEDNQHGQVQIWIYEERQYVSARYNAQFNIFKTECAKAEKQCYPGDPKPIPDLGESARMIDVYNLIGADSFSIVFNRCNAVVLVNIRGVANDPDGVITYAQRLDERLTSIVCR